MLGTFRTICPVLALRWLGGQALWIADRIDADLDANLDTDPDADPHSDPDSGFGPRSDLERSAWVQSLGRLPVGSAPDHPAELRAWYEDRQGQREAQAHIKKGNPFLVVVPDTDCTYTLSVHPDQERPAALRTGPDVTALGGRIES
ncbi:hypothetical protein ACF08M_11270 [Streptomyces sp. NPDC015032]|uniref:hypothetical protein n=1 Tax=Streptomyces sp. NPDC015032 TaxID=3364937 RepID=UPI0036FAF897